MLVAAKPPANISGAASRHAKKCGTGTQRDAMPSSHVSELPFAAPLIIGATGGSGTRVVAEMLQLVGFHLGRKLNPALDSMDGKKFVREWIPEVLAASDGLTSGQERAFSKELIRRWGRHREGMEDPTGPWLVKNPRWIYLLREVDRRWPTFRFLHLVRDGRDMAFSKNQAQAKNLGPLVDGIPADAPLPVRSVALWSKINLDAVDFGEKQLQERYLLIRFEDLCADPRSAAEEIFRFSGGLFGKDLGDSEPAAALVRSPTSVGRWREQPAEIREAVCEAGAPGLARFGYS